MSYCKTNKNRFKNLKKNGMLIPIQVLLRKGLEKLAKQTYLPNGVFNIIKSFLIDHKKHHSIKYVPILDHFKTRFEYLWRKPFIHLHKFEKEINDYYDGNIPKRRVITAIYRKPAGVYCRHTVTIPSQFFYCFGWVDRTKPGNENYSERPCFPITKHINNDYFNGPDGPIPME